MTVTVVCFGAMREYLPADADGNLARMEVAEGARVGDLVDALGAARHLVFAVLVDGSQASLEETLSDGAEVTLMPPFTGGASVVNDGGALRRR
jgi:molybdopterin converting factor small subunit